MQPFLYTLLLLIQTICAQACELGNGKEGLCTKIKDCPSALNDIKRKKFPITCRFEGKLPIVCCEAAKKSKSEEMCEKWDEMKFVDTFVPAAGIGGFDSLAKEFPHMAAIGYGSEETRSWSCGGTLISEKFILTAAHCLNSRNLGKPNTVRLGELNLNTTTDDAMPQDYTIKRVIPHPNYKAPSKYNDIALLELEDEVIFSEYMFPACLQSHDKIESDFWTATGWGLIGFDGPQANHLQTLYLNEFTQEECNEFYKKTMRVLQNGVVDSQICAGKDGVDTCQGDSGGPLQVYNELGLYNIIGITSFGKPCGLTKAPGVYTRVSKYVDWIESVVWP